MPVCRGDIDPSARDLLAVDSRSDRKRRLPGKDSLQLAGSVGWDVQDNEDGGGKVCRQVLEEADERFDASRRGADHYDVSLLFH
jgi:hypothetical protein